MGKSGAGKSTLVDLLNIRSSKENYSLMVSQFLSYLDIT